MFQGTIREMHKQDLDAVKSIIDLYWQDDFKERVYAKFDQFVSSAPEAVRSDLKCFVAEENGEVVGVAVMRKAPAHMIQFTSTANPAELYVSAVKYKNVGIGSALRAKRVEVAREKKYTEIVLFGGEGHQDSWLFHDDSDFRRFCEAVAPNGEKGYIWRLELK